MSYTPNETKEMRASVALELLRHKVLVDIGRGYPGILNVQDINEILIVAGLPVIVPGEVKTKEVTVIATEEGT